MRSSAAFAPGFAARSRRLRAIGAQRREQRREVRRRRGLPLHRLAAWPGARGPGAARAAPAARTTAPRAATACGAAPAAIRRIAQQWISDRRSDARGSGACARFRAGTARASRPRTVRARPHACARPCRLPPRPSTCVASDAGRSAHRWSSPARDRRARAPDTRASPCAPRAGARGPCARAASWPPPSGRSCPCRAGARCPRAAAWRAPARDAAVRSSSVPSRLPLPGCTTRPAGLSSTTRSASSCTTASAMSSGRCVASATAGPSCTSSASPPCSRCRASTTTRPFTRTWPLRSTSSSGCANAARTSARAPGRAAPRRVPPGRSPRARRRSGRGGGPRPWRQL